MNTRKMMQTLRASARPFVSLGLLAAVVCSSQVARAEATQTLRVAPQMVGYYEAYLGPQNIDKIPWKSLTRLNVAFIGVDTLGVAKWLEADGKNMPERDMGASVKTIAALVAARKANNPDVKLLLSVGGASMSNRFSMVARDDAKRHTLAMTTVRVAKSLGLDGVDYDWEYPGRLVGNNCELGRGKCATTDDFVNLTKLLKETRAEAVAQEVPSQLLTVAVYFDPSSKGVPYDVAGMDAQLDAWNIMAYDGFAPSWYEKTAFHAGITLSEQSMVAFASRGATPAKLILGVPFYGYIWTSVPFAGVDATPTAAPKSDAGRQVGITKLWARYEGTEGCKLFETNDGDYYYCSYGALAGEWCAIDSVSVLQKKANFVRDHGYGGMMSWALSMDTDKQLLTHTLVDALQ